MTADTDQAAADNARRLALIKGVTQALIAVGVSTVTLFAALRGIQSEAIGNVFILIIAWYFGKGTDRRN